MHHNNNIEVADGKADRAGPAWQTDLGEPFATYARLLLAVDAAKCTLHAAMIAGERGAIARAELDRDAALGDLQAFKTHWANALLMFARFTAELYPDRDLFRRLDELEETVASIAVSDEVQP